MPKMILETRDDQETRPDSFSMHVKLSPSGQWKSCYWFLWLADDVAAGSLAP